MKKIQTEKTTDTSKETSPLVKLDRIIERLEKTREFLKGPIYSALPPTGPKRKAVK